MVLACQQSNDHNYFLIDRQSLRSYTSYQITYSLFKIIFKIHHLYQLVATWSPVF